MAASSSPPIGRTWVPRFLPRRHIRPNAGHRRVGPTPAGESEKKLPYPRSRSAGTPPPSAGTAATAFPISRSPPPAPTPATGHSGQTPYRRIDVQMDPPKAQWDAVAAQFFCECAANQVRKGNRPTKFLTLAGYKGLAEEFNAKTGRNYEKKQFKNRWDDLKSIYSAWVFYKNKSTGLGWDDVKQTITADDDQWAELIKIHKPIRAFRKGPPDNLKELTVMFEVYDEENETPAPSPVQPRPKHPAPMSASAIPHSPSKMSVPFTDAIGDRATKYLTWLVAFKVSCFQMRKSDIGQPANVKPLLIIIGGANVDGLSIPVPPNPKRKEASAITCSPSKLQKNNVSRDFNDDISAIMEEVAKCGASETSDEYFKERK